MFITSVFFILNIICLGVFQAYDYGNAAQNLKVYNNTKSPNYKLKNVAALAVLFYSLGDYFGTKEVHFFK